MQFSIRLLLIATCGFSILIPGCGREHPAANPSATDHANAGITMDGTVPEGATFEGYTMHNDGQAISVNRTDTSIEVRVSDGTQKRELMLEIARDQPADKPYRLYTIQKLEPNEPIGAEQLQWFFKIIGPKVAIQAEDGTIIEHPDLPIMAEQMRKFDEQPTAAAAVLDDLRRLISMESRVAVFAHMVQAKELAPETLDELVRAVSAGSESVLLAIDSEGRQPANGIPLLIDAIGSLVAREDLGQERADRLARSSEKLRFDYYESQLLERLIGKTSLDFILGGAAHIADGQIRHNLLLELVRQLPLNLDDADKIVAATPSINFDYYESHVLIELADKATIPSLIAAAEHISDAQIQHNVMMEMMQQPKVSRESLGLIAQAVPRLKMDYYEQTVLVALAGRAPVERLLESAAQISDGQLQHNVLLAMAEDKRLTAEDAERIARATPKINFDYYEMQILIALAPHTSIPAILDSAAEIEDSRQQHGSIIALLGRPAFTREEASSIAAVVPRINFDYYESQVLKELVGKASIESLLTAVEQISDGSQKYEILSALTRIGPLEREDANRLASGAEQIEFPTYRAEILLALVGRADDEVLRRVAKTVSNDADRLRILDALNQ